MVGKLAIVKAFVFVVLFLGVFGAYAQTTEICNDGIDNDGNGLIDCADPFCGFAANIERGCNCFDNVDNDGDGVIDKADPNCASYYGLTFVGEGSNCSLTPPGANTPFDLVSAPAAVSGQNTSDTQSKVAVGDIDGDGIPDVAITSKFNSNLRIVATSDNQPDGKDAGDIKSEYNINGSPILPYNSKFMYEHDVLIADIDKDGKSEIFGIISDRPPQGNSVAAVRFFLVGFRYTINTLTPLYNAIDLGPDRPGIPGIADFDGDGKAEIYLKDEIYAAETGAKLADGGGVWDTEVNAAPVAVNIFPATPNMELVTGKFIYTVPNLSSRTLQTLTVAADMSTVQAYFPKVYNDLTEYGIDNASSTSVADVDEDGFLDVVLSGSTTQYTQNGPGQTSSVFYWNVQKNKVSVFNPPDPNLAKGWTWGTSRINLGDANGDGKIDLSFIAGNQLFCLTTDASDNLVSLWATPRTINDSNSGIVAVTIYDFDNDGSPELVYRDSQEVVVVDGTTGQSKLWSATCKSHTFTEGPIIADVNGDGGTDICVPCFRGPGAFSINGSLQEQARGEVRLWYSTGNEWLPTRKVWNQPGYFVVNINDNLTLPFPQLDQTLVFGNTPCPNGIPGPNQPLNVFLNQVPNLSADGCPIFPAPDLAFFGDDPANPGVDLDGDGVYTPAVVVTPPICGNLDISAFFNIVNSGDLPISDNVPVAFFNGDPLNGGTYLHNAVLNVANLQVGQTLQTPSVSFNGPGTIFTLYIVLYSDGSLPLVINNTKECSIANNTYTVLITPEPFTTTIEKVSDNFKCDNSAPDSGELRAHISKGGVETFDYSPYAFQWYLGSDTSTPIPGPEGTDYILANAPEGIYTLVVTNTQKGCVGDPVTETIVRLGNDPDITINVISDQTLCSPANGQLEAVIAQGNTGFTFEWFDISLNPLGISGPTANNLTAGNYLVRVSKDGCIKVSDPVTVNGPQIPDAQAQVLQNVVDCSTPNSGSITVDALFNGVIQDPSDYQFDWYFYDNGTSTQGSILPPANGTGKTRTGLAAGFYQAEIKQISTQCVSLQTPVVEVQTATIIPTASIAQVAPQTSCDGNNPNGILVADALVGGVPQNPADFTFEWFKGDNTLPANLHTSVSDVNGRQANQVSGGGEYYTVRVTTAFNCSATEKFIIGENIQVPVVTLATSPNGICDPVIAGTNYSGSLTATVTFGGAPVADGDPNYSFSWHDGGLPTDPAPSPNSATKLLSGQDAGTYTLVVTRTDLFCASAPVTEQIANGTILPVLTTTSTPSTNCTPGLEDGIAEVVTVDGTAVGSTSGYSYDWTGPVAPAFPVNGSNNDTSPQLIDLQGGAGYDYTVLVTNLGTGCQTTAAVNVADAKVIPVITLTPGDNGICDPSLTVPSVPFAGSITATVDNQVGALTDYSFAFGGGQNAGITNGNLYQQLNGGPTPYTAVATHVPTGCVSGQVGQIVSNVQSLPVLTSSTTPSTNCAVGLEDGIAEVLTVDGTPVSSASGFTYAWTGPVAPAYPVNGPTNNSNTAQLIRLQGGAGYDYTVLVTNQANGCQTSLPLNVSDARVIPAITLTPADNGICDPSLTVPATPFNGSITATVNNLVGAITDYSFAFGGGQNAGVTSGNIYQRLNGGPTPYTAVATHVPTGCVSPQVDQVVNNVQTFPVLTTASTASTNCAPGLENGVVQVLTVDGIPGIGAPGYTFLWTGPVAPAFPVDVPTNNSNTARLNKVQGGAGYDYTVLVTKQSNGCQTTLPLNVADAKVIPVITLTPGNNGICDPALTVPATPFNGSITATVINQVGAITDYSFVFGGGQNAGVTNVNVYEQLNGGPTPYNAVATHVPTGCVSSQVDQVVNNVQSLPVLTTSTTSSTHCAPGLENGIARVVTVDGTPVGGASGYTYQWTGPVAPAFPVDVPTNNADTPQLIRLQGGIGFDYEVLVTNQANGCQTNLPLNVPDGKQLPVLTLTPQPNTICDPALTNPPTQFDGQVSAVVNSAGNYTGNIPADFTFSWNTGLTGIGQNLLANRDVGTYSVTALHTTTGCQSASFSAQVTSAKTLPTITVGQTPSTNCPGGVVDGIASVTSVLPNGRTYNYNWYDGSAVSGTPDFQQLGTVATTSNYSGVQGGLSGVSLIPYTVEVTILETGCVNTATVGVDDDSQVPVLGPLVATDNTLCTVAKNGTATISTLSYRGAAVPPADFGQYTFTWSGGTQGPAQTITALPLGSYTLTVTNISSQCTSNPVSANVDDDLYFPIIDVVDVDQTSCNPVAPNGQLTATIDETSIGGGAGVTAGYTFTWVDDVTTASTASNAISNLKGDQTYSITAVRDATQCTTTQAIYLNETITIPTVTVAPVDLTICNPPNGSLTATPLPAATYSFFWYDGNDAVDEAFVIANADFTGGAVYSGLIPGDYTVVVRDDNTECVSAQVIETVADASPPISPVAANTAIPTDCVSNGGQLDAGIQTINSNFSALAATDELTTVAPLGLAVNDRVIIQRNGALVLPTGLEEDKIYFIRTIVGNVITLSATSGPGPIVNLTSDGDGNIGDYGTAGFTYEWYSGVPSAANPLLGTINYFTNPPVYGGAALSATSTLGSIPSGLYTIEVTDAATGCKAYLPHTLPFLGAHAVVKINKTNSSLCPYTIGDGSIEIQIEDPATAPPAVDQNDYLVALLPGGGGPPIVPSFAPVPPVAPFFVTNTLAPGTYVLQVQEQYSGFFCDIFQDVVIDADGLPPIITLASPIIPNTACTPAAADGQIEINVSKDPDDVTVGVTFDIDMAPDPNAAFPLLAQAPGNFTALNLDNGSYTFTATGSNGCASSKAFTMFDDPVVSEIIGGNVLLSKAEYCTVALEQSARAEIVQLDIIGGGAENLDDYQFDWFTDATLTTNVLSAVGDNTAAKGGEILSNTGGAPLPVPNVTNGAYWVTATKLTDLSGTGGIGCRSAAFSFNIGSDKIFPQVTLTPFGDTSCDPNFFEGSIQVDVTTASGPGAGGTYGYFWNPNGGVGDPVNVPAGNSGVANLIPNVDEGTYQLTTTNDATGCSTILSTSVLRKTPPVFTLQATASNLTFCSPFNGRVDNLQVFVNGAAGNIPDFDYIWYQTALTGPVVIDGQNVGVPDDTQLTLATFPGIALGTYFVKGIRKAGGAGVGCESAALRKDILDDRVFPQVALSQVSNTACDGNFDGRITINASTSGGPGAGSNYDFVWSNDPDGLGGALFSAADGINQASPYSTLNTDLVGPGSWSVDVTNLTTQCPSSGSIVLQTTTVPMEIVSTTATPVNQCAPLLVNGSGTVVDVEIAGAAGQSALFSYTWDDDPLMGSPFVVDAPALTQSGLDVGVYYVRARRNAVASPITPGVSGSGCTTAPVPFEVLDARISPSVSLSQVENTACDGNFDGRITIAASTASGPGVGSNYDFVWTNDPDGLGGVAFSATNGINQASPYSTLNTDLIGPGTYSVDVTNTTTRCVGSGTIVLQTNTVPMQIVSTTATPVDQCAPLPVNGTGTVTDVRIGLAAGQSGLFTYTWDDDQAMGSPFVVNDPLLTQGNRDVGVYYVRATRNAVVSPATPGITGSGCFTAPVPFEVLDARITPSVSLSQVSNTACDGNFDGRITVTASTVSGPGAGSNYDFVWTNDPDGLGGAAFSATDGINQASPYNTLNTDLIGPGSYSVNVTNTTTQCVGSGSITLQTITVPQEIVSAIATPVDVCLPLAPNGSGTVTDVKIGAAVGQSALFSYTWDDDPLMGSPFVVDDPALGQNGLDIGTFYVRARRNPVASPATPGITGSGCVTAPIPFVVENKRITPSVNLSQVANTACDGNFDGQITVTASTVSGPGAGANYDFLWTVIAPGSAAANPGIVPSPYTTQPADLIGPGSYSVQVTNAVTQCVNTGSVVLISNPQPLDVLTVNKTDQAICFPDGSISVTALSSGGPGNYSYQWFRNDPATPPLVDGGSAVITTASIDNVNYPSIGADSYFVVATKNAGAAPGSGCSTPPFRVDILDQHVDPRFQFTTVSNSSCNIADPNGNILAQIVTNGNNSIVDTYSFAWAYNGGALPAITDGSKIDNANNSQLIDAFEGNYALTVTNTSNTGCSFTAGVELKLDLTISLPNIIDANTVDPLDCLASGSATVTRVGIGGITFFNDPPDDLDLNFDYKWFDGNLGNQIAGEVNHDLQNRLPGTYYVTVTDGSTLCESGPKEVVINDDDIVYPVVNILQTARQISCDAITGTAALAATADGQNDTNVDYQFSWFTTLDASGPSFANTSTITGQQAGDYSVDVFRVSTGCSSQALYIVPDEAPRFTPVISLGGQGRTLCVGQDGSVLARVIDISPLYPFPLDFTSDLYFGASPNLSAPADVPGMTNIPGFAANFLESNLAEGFYTVRITDNNTGCIAVATHEVLDQRVPPVVTIVQDNPLTNCDPTIANGQLSATADGGKVSGYNFEWYAGTAVASPPATVLSTINKLIASGAGDYVTRVTNRITGCFADLSAAITDATLLPPVPTAVTVRDRTNCLVPNGWVAVSVGGEVVGYDFNWYDGGAVTSTVDFNGVNYLDRDIGDYTVTATDVITGCISPPATTPVADARKNPEFIIETTPSFCIDTGRPTGNGSVVLTLTNGDDGDVVIEDVVWVDMASNQPVGIGTAVYDLFPGFYEAQAVTVEGCTNEGIGEVKTEISPYNGVSTNADGANDVFIVDCISLFPNNNVKIFNRNGIKVYEADGYNNGDIAFSGLGIDGLYLQGKELPVGTYFYVIDKRDGSKPVAGYLELDR